MLLVFQVVGRPGARVFELEGVSVRAKFRFSAFVTNGFNADGLLLPEVSVVVALRRSIFLHGSERSSCHDSQLFILRYVTLKTPFLYKRIQMEVP
jgi:hypothetical protein